MVPKNSTPSNITRTNDSTHSSPHVRIILNCERVKHSKNGPLVSLMLKAGCTIPLTYYVMTFKPDARKLLSTVKKMNIAGGEGS
jgi:hypothetical protein